MNILIIDHHDSFTWNISAQIRALKDISVEVIACTSPALNAEKVSLFSGIILSPGPGHPDAALRAHEILEHFHRLKPFLGICLGHQVIASHFGASIAQSLNPIHGKTSRIIHDGQKLFAGLKPAAEQMRYHSLYAADPLPCCLEASARTEDGVIMGLRHRKYPIEGIQFHPESVLSENGKIIFTNWIDGIRSNELQNR